MTYRRAGEVDMRAAAWMVGPGIVGVDRRRRAHRRASNTHLLLVVTAVLLAWQAVGILRGARPGERRRGPRLEATPSMYLGIGLVAGFVSGLLGIGGGLVMVPLLAGWLGMPLKRALGTSLLAIVALVIPGTIVHAALGHIDWAIFAVVTLGAVPGRPARSARSRWARRSARCACSSGRSCWSSRWPTAPPRPSSCSGASGAAATMRPPA